MLTLTQVRLHELFHSRARNSNRIFLGDPQHALSNYNFAKTAVRLATDGNGYTFREFEEEYGEWATWNWERAVSPSLIL